MKFREVIILSACLMSLNCSTTNQPSDLSSRKLQKTEYMQHPLRTVIAYDKVTMVKLVEKELDTTEPDYDTFINGAAKVLGETVMVHPEFGAREAGLRQLRSKMQLEDYYLVIDRAATKLLYIAGKGNAADQATAFVSLNNLVAEIKSLKASELQPTLNKIAAADLELSREAEFYSKGTMKQIKSPSSSAKTALSSTNFAPTQGQN